MGAVQSNTAKETFTELSTFINNNTTTISNIDESKCKGTNLLRLSTGGGKNCNFEFNGGIFRVNLSGKGDCELSSDNVASIENNIQNKIQNLLNNFINQGGKSTQDFLDTAISIQDNNLSSSDQLVNMIKNNIDIDVSNTCSNQLTTSNNAQINLCGVYNIREIDISENITNTGLTSCVNKLLATSTENNQGLNEIIMRTDQQLLWAYPY